MSAAPLSKKRLWHLANQQLIARAISEFVYEQELIASPSREDQSREEQSRKEPSRKEQCVNNTYQVTLGDATYQFNATPTLWDLLVIKPTSLSRDEESATDALQFCLDIKVALSVDEIIFGNWLEDVQNTLHNEFQRLQKLAQYHAEELLKLDEPLTNDDDH